jgi:hypothetical protein
MRSLGSLTLPAWFPWLFSMGGVGPGGFGDASMGGAPNPYGSPTLGGAPAPKQSKTWLWILLGVGGGLALACCGCLGAGSFGFFGVRSMMASGVKNQFQDHEIVKEQIGEIESSQWNIIESGQETERAGKRGGTIIVVDVKGNKGSGKIIGPQAPNPQGDYILQHGTLRMPSGQEFDLGE